MTVLLDLGCGKEKMPGSIGIDRVGPPLTQADIVTNLAFEPIPFDNNSVDKVRARFFLEHIPFVIWDTDGTRTMPMVFLFNDVYRVLKSGGLFEAEVPNLGPIGPPVPRPQVAWAGIEHTSFWTWETPLMFSGNYYGYKEIYGHTSNFKLIRHQHIGDEYMSFVLEAQ